MQQHCGRSTAADGTKLRQRLGLHIGPAITGVVGDTYLRYQLFGPLRSNVTMLEQACSNDGGGVLASSTFREGLGPFAKHFAFSPGPELELIDPHGGSLAREATWQIAWAGTEAELRTARAPPSWPADGDDSEAGDGSIVAPAPEELGEGTTGHGSGRDTGLSTIRSLGEGQLLSQSGTEAVAEPQPKLLESRPASRAAGGVDLPPVGRAWGSQPE